MIVNKALCEGRHEIKEATDGYIFGAEVSERFFAKGCDINVFEDYSERVANIYKEMGFTRVNLYVTGLTVALISIIKALKNNDIDVVLYHYNNADGSYYEQTV